MKAALQGLKSKVDINIYFVTTANETDILHLQKSLQALPEVASVTYTSSDAALAAFEAKHPNDGTVQAISELGTNPLGAVLNVQAKDPSQYQAIADFLSRDNVLSSDGLPIIDKVNYYEHQESIDTLTKIIDAVNRFGFWLSLVLVVISVFITLNTIRLTIYVSRDEIAVMKLVGASNRYIRGPFVVGGIMYGVISALITLALFYPVTYYLKQVTASLLAPIDLFHYYVVNFSQVFIIVMGAGILIGAISSYLAVRRYLRV